jgi:peptidoglycan lytic transglycosylase D
VSRQASRRKTTAAHYVAPAAFLIAVTIAVFLIRAGLNSGHPATTGQGPVTQTSTASTTPRGTTRRVTTTLAGGRFYTVQTGDTFGSISAKTGVPISQLERLNPGVSSNALQVGQRLRIK